MSRLLAKRLEPPCLCATAKAAVKVADSAAANAKQQSNSALPFSTGAGDRVQALMLVLSNKQSSMPFRCQPNSHKDASSSPYRLAPCLLSHAPTTHTHTHAFFGSAGASVAGGADEAGAARCVHPPPARRCRPHRSRRRAAAAGARVAGGAGAACAAACGALASMPAGRADVVGFVAVARVSATRGAGGGAPGRVCGRSRECGRGRAHQGAGACGKGQESSGGRGSAALPSSPGCDEHARKECVGA
mmetsp:Transcript_14515/g.42355  ORF Transcript_14515/g.42355 Transcript_14515/m.42355 type:complete len:246 (-) Transcript_14515:342-1079(-)